MKKRLALFLVFLLLPSIVFADGFGDKGLLIEEEDGDPSDWFDTLKTPNSSLTDNGDGSVSLDFGTLGDVTAIGDCATGACFNGTQGTTLTFNNAGGDGTLDYDGTDFSISKPIDITGTVTATGGNSTNWNTAYTHSQDNTQAHSDYLLNTGDDMTGDLSLSGTGPDITLVVTGGDTFGWHAENSISYFKNNTDSHYYYMAETSHDFVLQPFGGTTRIGGVLRADGDTTIGGTLGVTGAATMSSLTTTGNVTVGGSLIVPNIINGSVDINNNLILNIGNAGTDFTSGGGLTLAGVLNISTTTNWQLAGTAYTGSMANLNTLRDDSMADTLHRHSELSASDGSPDAALQVDATGQVGIGGTPSEKLEVVGDVKIKDATPHLEFEDSTASEDDFEFFADNNSFYLSNLDDSKILFYFDSLYQMHLPSGNLILENGGIDVSGNINGATLTEAGSTVPNATDNLSFFSSTTSAQLAGVISNETGSGALVFGTSPTFTTPNIGVATATANIKGEPKHLRFTIVDPLATQTEDNETCIWPETDAAITITKITVTLNSAANEVAGDLKYADTFIGLANATVINVFDTSSGVLEDDTITNGAVAAGKTVYAAFDSPPNTAITQMCVDVQYDYD